ncbi:uncharacterized protein LOC135704274 [Ochlerotatus camptorhynchus]|uniref:uncharacterized protein LOC135704274 n=1 Tax=Ochlerotatus camptorhynchus TaxID=644619 RepID=UPI0031DF11F5
MVRKRTTAPASEGPSKKAQMDPSAASDDTANRLLQSCSEKKEHIPPLFTPMKDVAQLRDELAKRKLFPRFKICSVGTKIMCSSLQQYKSVGDLLKNRAVEFYTHDLPSMKPLKVVLRGLPSYDAATVKDELVIINWEYYKPQHRDVTQCTSCLSFGHGTKNCHMKPRCDKCAMAHSTATCAQADDTDPKCVNCGGTHRATTRDCPKRTEFITMRKKVATSNQPGRHRNKRAPPVITDDEQYPAIHPRRLVPNLPPLPLNNSQRAAPSAQHRLTAAAALPNQASASAPGLSYARVASGDSVEESPLTSEELVTLVAEVIVILRTCMTRSEQLHAALSLVTKYGP